MLLILSLCEVAKSRGPKVVHIIVSLELQKFRFEFIRVYTLSGSSFLGSQVQFVLLALGIAQKKTHTHTHKQNHDVSCLAGKVNAYLIWMGNKASGPKTSEPQCGHADPKFRNLPLRSTRGHDFVNVMPPFHSSQYTLPTTHLRHQVINP